MRRFALLLVVGACTTREPEAATLAELGPVTLDLYVSRQLVEATVRYPPQEGCAMMGRDFHANISGVAATMWPGGDGNICVDPAAMFLDWPSIDDAVLELGDTSRTIRCELKDVLVPRQLVRVDKDTWDVHPQERVTVRWEPAHDVDVLEYAMSLDVSGNVYWHRDGDQLWFNVPSVLPGMHTIWVAGHGVVDNANGCDGVPNELAVVHHASANLNVTW